jgi:hypothetical protein
LLSGALWSTYIDGASSICELFKTHDNIGLHLPDAAPGIKLRVHELHPYAQVMQFCALEVLPPLMVRNIEVQSCGLINIVACLSVLCTWKVMFS